jgi:RND superfamily putative drug exporter
MAQILGRIAASAAGHWKRSAAIVLAVLVALGLLASTVGDGFVDEFSTPGTESQQALDLLEQRFPARAGDTATVVFAVEDGALTDPERADAIDAVAAEIAGQPHVTEAPSPLSEAGAGQLSEDGRIGFITVQYDQPANDIGAEADERLAEAAAPAEEAGIEVSRNGQIVDVAQQSDAPVGEVIGVAVAVIVLTLVFGSAAAMGITLVSALIALVGGVMLLTLGTTFTSFPSFAPTLGVMLGLGAGIDYALLIVGRYREQLASDNNVPHAAAVANRTAGVSVLAAGAIVVVAIAGLLATGIPFVGQMGLGAAIMIATVAVGAVTVLPVMMGAAAKRMRPKKARHTEPSAAFGGWARQLVARPWLAVTISTLVLATLATPFIDLRLGQPDDGSDAKGETTRIAYDRLAEGFGPGFNGPLVLAAALEPDSADQLDAVRRAVAGVDNVATVSQPTLNEGGDAATLTVIPKSSPQDPATSDLVETLREKTLPATTAGTGVEVYVGGSTATFDDLAQKIADRLPVFIALVVGLAVLLLMAVFRSLWVPLISAAFNLLSIGAAYGVVVAVFQWGWFGFLFGVPQEGVPIVSFVPLFMFAVLFGLSMDYNVFLQSRIREEYMKGETPDESVINGLARVGRVILAAGAIMTAVFLGFVTDPDIVVKTIGLGLASAIVIDVVVVRMALAPAVMALLGDRAWRLPSWLDRVLPRISLEGAEVAALPGSGPGSVRSQVDPRGNGSAPEFRERLAAGAGRPEPRESRGDPDSVS